MYFYGNKLYSYGSHYLLCEFIKEDTVMINDTGYSNTTSKHISLIIGATRDKKQYFKSKTDYKAVNLNIKNYLKKVVNARKTKEYYLSALDSNFKMYFDYLEFSKQKTKFKKYAEHRETLRLSSEFYNNFDNLQQTIKENAKKQAAKDKKAMVKKIKEWKNGSINWFQNKTNFDYLRMLNENIETSQNVKISIKEAKRVLKLIESKKVIGQKIDDRFTVTAFNGFLKVGCHNIPLTEINYIKNLI